MKKKTKELCDFFSDLTSLTVTSLAGEESVQTFCKQNCFSSIQNYLQPELFNGMVHSLAEREMLHLVDHFGLHLLFFRIDGEPLVVGPYCVDILTVEECCLLLHRLGMDELLVKDYMSYRSQFPVLAADHIRTAVRSLLRHATGTTAEFTLRQIAYGQRAFGPADASEVRLPYSTLISNRYALEMQMMDYITAGNAHAAIENMQILDRDVSFMTCIGNTMENARIGAAIVRTCIRLAASRAGLSAWMVDRISNQHTKRVFSSRTIDEIHHHNEEMVREYCHEINQQKDARYSPLVLSARYYLRKNYRQPCTLAEIAAELDVAPGVLSNKFRKETGQSINAYLTDLRMDRAARILAGSDTPIQQIAETVGILDANYFIKIFKKQFGMTPGQYRKTHQI